MGKLFFWWGTHRTSMLHVHMHVWVELEKQIEEKFKLNRTGKMNLVNHPSSTDRNFLIQNWNSAFYPPLERMKISLGFWYSRFFQISFRSRLKVQSCLDGLIWPELILPQISVAITPEPLVGWGCICASWKGLKIPYHFRIVHFSWFCGSLSQRSFVRSSAVWIKICIQDSSTCALGSNDHNFVPVYQIRGYE
jgi:hypothetical protein